MDSDAAQSRLSRHDTVRKRKDRLTWLLGGGIMSLIVPTILLVSLLTTGHSLIYTAGRCLGVFSILFVGIEAMPYCGASAALVESRTKRRLLGVGTSLVMYLVLGVAYYLAFEWLAGVSPALYTWLLGLPPSTSILYGLGAVAVIFGAVGLLVGVRSTGKMAKRFWIFDEPKPQLPPATRQMDQP